MGGVCNAGGKRVAVPLTFFCVRFGQPNFGVSTNGMDICTIKKGGRRIS